MMLVFPIREFGDRTVGQPDPQSRVPLYQVRTIPKSIVDHRS